MRSRRNRWPRSTGHPTMCEACEARYRVLRREPGGSNYRLGYRRQGCPLLVREVVVTDKAARVKDRVLRHQILNNLLRRLVEARRRRRASRRIQSRLRPGTSGPKAGEFPGNSLERAVGVPEARLRATSCAMNRPGLGCHCPNSGSTHRRARFEGEPAVPSGSRRSTFPAVPAAWRGNLLVILECLTREHQDCVAIERRLDFSQESSGRYIRSDPRRIRSRRKADAAISLGSTRRPCS